MTITTTSHTPLRIWSLRLSPAIRTAYPKASRKTKRMPCKLNRVRLHIAHVLLAITEPSRTKSAHRCSVSRPRSATKSMITSTKISSSESAWVEHTGYKPRLPEKPLSAAQRYAAKFTQRPPYSLSTDPSSTCLRSVKRRFGWLGYCLHSDMQSMSYG